MKQQRNNENMGTSYLTDFNNLLTAIIGFTTLAQISTEKDDTVSKYLEEALIAAERAATLTRNVNEITIKRALEFPPEHCQAAIGILSYFSEIIKQKHPGIDAKVRIEQTGNMVRMEIETLRGEKETIEKTLEDYALVVLDKRPIESLLDNQVQILALKNKLEIANLEIRQTKELLAITKENYSTRVTTLEEDVTFLKQQISSQMLLISDSHRLLEKESSTGKDLIAKHISYTERLVRDLVLDAWHNKDLADALISINKKLEAGITDNDEVEVKLALTAVRNASPALFSELADALKNTMYGVSGNVVYQWLVSLGYL